MVSENTLSAGPSKLSANLYPCELEYALLPVRAYFQGSLYLDRAAADWQSKNNEPNF
jgi:hypothetical protein